MDLECTAAREAAGKAGRFPSRLREALVHAVKVIRAEELPALLARHESAGDNLDARIGRNLREALPACEVTANRPVSRAARFNSDLAIRTGEVAVCVEIEKGELARFELDVLKMQAFAAEVKREESGVKCFGAFIVPSDNKVARHITGNAEESSYDYLCRLGRLVLTIEPLLLEDILLIGYGKKRPKRDRRTSATGAARGDSVIRSSKGLLADDVVAEGLAGYPTGGLMCLRKCLAEECLGLREKFNRRQRYLGYATGPADAAYVYVQKRRLVLDLRLPPEQADEIRKQGFEVIPRDNFQGRAGWLTGVRVPHDTDKKDLLSGLVLKALKEE